MIHLYNMLRIGQSIETENRLVVARGQERRKWGVAAHRHGVSFSGDEMFWN